MQKILFVASLFVLAAFAAIPTNPEILSLWSSWKVQNNKLYNLAENRARFAIFCDNYRKVLKFNAENETPKLGLNKFADLTAEEFKNQNSRCAFFESNREFVKAHTWDYNPNEDRVLPASVDWRTKGVVTPVKNQGQCGSCWSFSTTGVLEGFYAIKEAKLLSFSEQQIVDCDTVDQGCDGGWPYQALVYAGKSGCELESTYPYTAQDGTCVYKKSEATPVNTGYVFVTPKDVDALKTAVVSMPVSVAIEADQDVFQLYTSGVITKNCGASLDHAVLVVGYTTISGTEAWIVKNSWAATWGDAGYVYISTNPQANAGTGVCGILSQPVIPK